MTTIVPLPQSLETSDLAPFVLNQHLSITLAPQKPSVSLVREAQQRYIRHWKTLVARRTGLWLADTVAETANHGSAIHIQWPGGEDDLLPVLESPESYKLRVENGRIAIEGSSWFALVRALASVLLSIRWDGTQWTIPSMVVDDHPHFPWRGLMLDLCRNQLKPATIERIADTMVLAKLNVLHLHLSDDQGWAYESTVAPILNGMDRPLLTQPFLKHLVDYCGVRGIRIVPELDVPGHCSAILEKYPQLGPKGRSYTRERGFGIFDGSLDPTNEGVYQLMEQLVGEISTIFPDQYFHMGGDENTGAHWLKDADIKRFMVKRGYKQPLELQRHFNDLLFKIIQSKNRTPMGWDEILSEGLPVQTLIQSWRGQESLAEADRAGYRSILSNGYYIDMARGPEYYYQTIPHGKKVLGGEATMWSELVSDQTVESRIWPHVIAIAQNLWSPDTSPPYPDFLALLHHWNHIATLNGSNHWTAQTLILNQIFGLDLPSELPTFMAMFRPLSGYRRHHMGYHSTRDPLCTLADCARPWDPRTEELISTLDSIQNLDHGPRAETLLELISPYCISAKEVHKWSQGHNAHPAHRDLQRLSQRFLQFCEDLDGIARGLGQIGHYTSRWQRISGPVSELDNRLMMAVMEAMGYKPHPYGMVPDNNYQEELELENEPSID